MMKKILLMFILLIGMVAIVACSKSETPTAPISEEVLRDVKNNARDALLGNANGENFSFTPPMIFEEEEIIFSEDKNTLNAEVVAYVGDQQWKSEMKKNITVRYEVNSSNEWQVMGMNINDAVIPVIPRTSNKE